MRDAAEAEASGSELSEPGPVKDFIDGILAGDEKAPKKQRHTARRIWQRIGQERPQVRVGEATVRRYVQRRKVALAAILRKVHLCGWEPMRCCSWPNASRIPWSSASGRGGHPGM